MGEKPHVYTMYFITDAPGGRMSWLGINAETV